MNDILSAVSTVITYLVGGTIGSGSTATTVTGWVPTIINLITAQPVLMLFCVALPLVGLGIGILKRLLNVRA